MKLNLQTRLFPQYNPMVSLAENKVKKEEEKKKEAEEKAREELYEALGEINSFALGTTPNFVIDLNKDMLKLEDIEQLTVTFGQFGKMVQREMLYFSDNIDFKRDAEGKIEYTLDYEGNYVPHTAEIVRDDHLIFDDNIHFGPSGYYEGVYDSEGNPLYDSEGNPLRGDDIYTWKHHHQTIRNPKFTYNRHYNTLTLTLSQMDTLRRFKPTDWYYHDEDEDKPSLPYWKNNPSLVMVEVKIRVKRDIDWHFNHQVIIRPQEYWAVADTIEHSLRDDGPVFIKEDHKTGADPIYVPHRFRIFYDDFSVPESEKTLPSRIEELHKSTQVATAILCRDGLRVRSYPQFVEVTDSEGHPIVDSEGHVEMMEVNRYFCFMIPLHIKVKVKAIKLLFGGSPGIMDHLDFDSEGRVIPSFRRYNEHEYIENEDNTWYEPEYDENGDPVYGVNRNETVYFNSNYVIDPDASTPENPMGEYICWYICSKETVTGMISRFYGPGKYREDQKTKPYYEFLIQFEEIRKANR